MQMFLDGDPQTSLSLPARLAFKTTWRDPEAPARFHVENKNQKN